MARKKSEALRWIITEAKKLRKKYPKRYSSWTDYVKQASAVYASKNRGASPVKRKKRMGAVQETEGKKPGARAVPASYKYGGGGAKGTKRRPVQVAGITTKSKTHTDYNRQRVNIQVGMLSLSDLMKERDKLIKAVDEVNRSIFLLNAPNPKETKSEKARRVRMVKNYEAIRRSLGAQFLVINKEINLKKLDKFGK